MEEVITVFGLVRQIIIDNMLTAEQEAELINILYEKERKKEEDRLSRCLVGTIKKALAEKVDSGNILGNTELRYRPIFKRCFEQSEVGNMDAKDLSQEKIKEFILETVESAGLNRNDYLCFKGLLKMGISKMYSRGLIDFTLPAKAFLYRVEEEIGSHYIDNPYSEEETEKIKNWIEKHTDDVRGNALGLWFLGGISPSEMVGLRINDYNKQQSSVIIHNEEGEETRVLLATAERVSILNHVRNLQSEENSDFIFMVYKNKQWEKLTDRSLPIKLFYICEELNIKYRPIHKNDILRTYDEICIDPDIEW